MSTNPTISLVVGPVNAGKSEFIRKNFSLDTHIIVSPGKIFRACLGIDAMMRDPTPNTSQCTEGWGKHIVRGALITAAMLSRPVVLDGYPRRAKQVEDMRQSLGSCFIGPVPVVAYYLRPPTPVLVKRIEEEPVREEQLFDEARLAQSVADCEEVMDALVTMVKGVEVRHVV